jgi:hypothetical protein
VSLHEVTEALVKADADDGRPYRVARVSPRGFDIRIVDSDGSGAAASLEWGGALLDPEASSPAQSLGDQLSLGLCLFVSR